MDNVADDDEVEYTYDAMGRRIMRKDVDNNTYIKYYYDGLTVIAEKKKVGAGSWDWNRIFTVGPGVIGNILKINTYDNVLEEWMERFYHYDAIGNVIYVTLGDALDSYYDQEAYGNVKVGSQSGYHLTTKEYDSIPELYYFWQRWYDPVFGKFLSIDPKNKSIFQYTLCINNPINSTDSSGLSISFDKSCCKWKNYITNISNDTLSALNMITDKKLRSCIERKINKGYKVKCDTKTCNNDPYLMGYAPGIDLDPLGHLTFGRIILCINNIWNWNYNNNHPHESIIDTIIHELAHTCGWDHGDGKGVPE